MLTRVSKQKLIGLVLIFDLMSMWALGLFALMQRGAPGMYDSPVPLITVVFVPLLAAYILQRIWAYTIPALGAFARQVRALLIAMIGAFVLVMGLYFVANINIMEARGWLLRWALYSVVLLTLFRLLTSRAVIAAEKRGELARRAVIVGVARPAKT